MFFCEIENREEGRTGQGLGIFLIYSYLIFRGFLYYLLKIQHMLDLMLNSIQLYCDVHDLFTS